ncbi:uncharacterized protein LOC134202495 [Armigeres subalbatus]|uniref:uncharacterized protein LOC134202495 n=1 Tax=Armigeres subalbatus TaxID=124917 RepID=UPI002ED5A436
MNSEVFENEAFNDDLIELPNDNFAAYCRLCFSISQLEPLFTCYQDENIRDTSIIEICTGIKLSPGTDSPSSICSQCRNMLEEFFSFRKLCQRVNRVYRRKRNELEVARKAAHHGVVVEPLAIESSVVPEQILVGQEAALEDISGGLPAPIEVTDTTCEVQIANEPSAFEASVAESLVVHELSDDDDEVECVGVMSLEESLMQHANAKDATESLPFIRMENDMFRCKICSGIYPSFVNLAKHFLDFHPEKASLIRSKSMVTYFKVKPGTLQTRKYDSQVLMKCDLCDTLLSSSLSVKRHRWRYHGAFKNCQEIPCSVPSCKSFFMDTYGLNRHLCIVHFNGAKTGATENPSASETDGVEENGNFTNGNEAVCVPDSTEDTPQNMDTPMDVVYSDLTEG